MNTSFRPFVTENHTPEFALRIRVRRLPTPGEFDEFELDYLRVDQTFVVPTQLASMLILAGIADLVESQPAAEAADFCHPRVPKRR
jgi:hypothetical protein